MIEPFGAAAAAGMAKGLGSAAGRMFRPSPRLRLGGREERRLVYGQYLQRTVQLHAITLGALGYGKFFTLRWIRHRLDEIFYDRAWDALEEAKAELLLVGNPEPIKVAEQLEAALWSYNLHRTLRAKANKQAEVSYKSALEAFIRACQRDLYYLPRWWQPWRIAWWKARWTSLKAWKQGRRELGKGTATA